MLWTIVCPCSPRLLGFLFHVVGALIHLLLVIALFVLAVQLLTGRRGSGV